jgi:hypothetical protein
MNINASLVDQQIAGILQDHAALIPPGDEDKRKSAAFVLLCMSTALNLGWDEAAELLTEGGNDAGVDGLHVGEVEDGEFLITLFQAKYKRNLDGAANFPENGVEKAVNTVQVLFDPSRKVSMNPRLAPKIEEIRSLIRDGYIPIVRFFLCNNGSAWNDQAGRWIESAKADFGDKLDIVHFNHDSIVTVLQRVKAVDATLTLSGQAIVEDMNYLRVIVGRVSAQEICRLFEEHGDRLLERNIRRYLGMHSNRVNAAIHQTLCDPLKSDKFYFYNNGVTVVCDKFDYNAFQKADYKVQLKNMQVINGGQTCKTIQQTLRDQLTGLVGESAYVMIRIYQLSESNKDFIQDITHATNSQNPVDLRDLHSNDEIQKQLEIGMEGLGYTYRRQREEGGNASNIINSTVVAEAVLAVWRQKPHQAKFQRKEHFDKLYPDIFQGLNAAQAILAVLIFRIAENERKRMAPDLAPHFLPYASHYIALVIGKILLESAGLALEKVDHRTFRQLVDDLDTKQAQLHSQAIESVLAALETLYGARQVSLQQLSATFRRGDLLEFLEN